jgi:hypothetical protein
MHFLTGTIYALAVCTVAMVVGDWVIRGLTALSECLD